MSQKLKIPTEIDVAAFISKEAHGLKSPFNRSLGFMKLVLKGMDGPISEQAQEDLTVAYQNIRYTLTMMNALVVVSRLGRNEITPSLTAHPVDDLMQKTISEWQRKYHKGNEVEITLSIPDIQVLADEIMIQQCFAYWISYVNEFVQEAASIKIQVDEDPDFCLFTIQSSGNKLQSPEDSDLTLYGVAAMGILQLHQGELISLEENDQGAVAQFKLPRV
jgi:signal transduction histidine kinase